MARKPDVYTIGEPGAPTEGYVVFGAKSIERAKRAIAEFDGTESFPGDEAFKHAKCRLQCWLCGHAHKAPNRSCDGDEEGWIWNFHAGRAAIVVLKDGTSVFDQQPVPPGAEDEGEGNQSFEGFPSDQRGFVLGELPSEIQSAEWYASKQITDVGYDVYGVLGSDVVVCGDAEPEEHQIHLRNWDPLPPAGEGWKLAWRGEDEDGTANVVWWRPRQGDVATHEIVNAF